MTSFMDDPLIHGDTFERQINIENPFALKRQPKIQKFVENFSKILKKMKENKRKSEENILKIFF